MGITTNPNPVRLEIAGPVAAIVLDRPPVNALCTRTQAELHRTATEVARRDDIRAVIICGANGTLSAGADIREMAAMTPEDMARQAPRLQATFNALAQIPKPVVAAIDGYALGGGCELALAADHRLCAATAILGLPEIRLGVIPAAGGTQRLTRLVGPSVATQLIYTGRHLTANEAHQIGLVDRIVPDDALHHTARQWATQLAAGPAAALAAAKTAINVGADLPLTLALQLETALFTDTFADHDRHIGMQAFLAHTTPHFTGTRAPDAETPQAST